MSPFAVHLKLTQYCKSTILQKKKKKKPAAQGMFNQPLNHWEWTGLRPSTSQQVREQSPSWCSQGPFLSSQGQHLLQPQSLSPLLSAGMVLNPPQHQTQLPEPISLTYRLKSFRSLTISSSGPISSFLITSFSQVP